MKPCPFCSAELVEFGPAQFNHPRNDCWLASVKVERHEFDAWNRRSELAAGAAAGGGTSDKSSELIGAGFVEAVKEHFVCGDYSFSRTPDGDYYNSVSTRSYGGRVHTEHAPISMLWTIWRAAIAAHNKAGKEPA